jgi:hypothetical protein
MAQDATNIKGSEHDAHAPPSLALLLQSCSSITEKVLSCRTLASKPPANDLIQTELELADWLNRQMLDHGAASRIASTTDIAGITSALQQNPRQLREQQQELLDESVRQQQEQLLLSRIEMSPIAQECLHSSNDWSVRQQSERVLLQEAVLSRDQQVEASLDKMDQLRHVLSQLEDVIKESQESQTQNKRLWQEISSDNKSGAVTETSLATETRILKRVLQDIIIRSDLDWYADERLRDTMLKLET